MIILLLAFSLLGNLYAGIPVTNSDELILNDIRLKIDIYADKRIADFVHQALAWDSHITQYSDSLCINFSSAEMNLKLSFNPLNGFGDGAYKVTARASFLQDILLHDLYLKLNFPGTSPITVFKGIKAIETRNKDYDYVLQPYTDMAIEYSRAGKSFWIVGSNHAHTKDIEGLAADRISLYDYKQHFYRKYRPQYNRTDLDRNTMPKSANDTHEWAFVLYTQKPVLIELNRWQGNNKAALAITNDADGESANSLKAVFMGSNNPANPKYYTQGLIANNIRVTNTVFGENYPSLKPVWDAIKEAGNGIGYHTFTDLADPPGANASALLQDLAAYDIRCWIDHSVPNNPEDVAYNGLDPDSEHYIGDILEQSNIDYLWAADTPPTNPFNAFEDPGRLPHRVYELSSVNKALWFYGRTRMETWEYLSGWNMVAMKYLMTSDNLDNLIRNRGLCIGYTHFSFGNTGNRNSFYKIASNGDWEVREDVNEMLQMLDHYQRHEGLWIEPVEVIFDRMLAIEKVYVSSITEVDDKAGSMLRLMNGSDMDIPDLRIKYKDEYLFIPMLLAGSSYDIYVTGNNLVPQVSPQYHILQGENSLKISAIGRQSLAPMKVKVYNLRGQKLSEHQSSANQETMDIPFAANASGIYFTAISETGYKPVRMRFTFLKQ